MYDHINCEEFKIYWSHFYHFCRELDLNGGKFLNFLRIDAIIKFRSGCNGVGSDKVFRKSSASTGSSQYINQLNVFNDILSFKCWDSKPEFI